MFFNSKIALFLHFSPQKSELIMILRFCLPQKLYTVVKHTVQKENENRSKLYARYHGSALEDIMMSGFADPPHARQSKQAPFALA